MLDFEAALARAEAAVGVIPAGAPAAIVAACDAGLYDLAALAAAIANTGNPAIPMVKQLTARVTKADPEAARFVHWGATSQDAMDTGLEIGRASCRERVGQYVEIWVVDVSLKKKQKKQTQ